MSIEYRWMNIMGVSGVGGWRAILLGLAVAAAPACGTRPNPASCSVDNHCSDPALPFCDVEGTLGGEPGECIAVGCTAGEFAQCDGDRAVVCNASGDDYDVVQCEFGCSDEAQGCNVCTPGSADCKARIIPRYLPDVCEVLASAPALTISASTMLDTNLDASCNGGVVEQLDGPSICVVRYATIALERNQTLAVTGMRALALVADESLTIDGILDVGARRGSAGPGGGFVTSGGGWDTANNGAGGAGFRTAGAPGGSLTADGWGGSGGQATPDPSLLVNLVGGTRPQPTPFHSAAAGGAATLISCSGEVSVPGIIDAGGGGGPGGGAGGNLALASGGGSGGYVVLQAMNVTVSGEVYANGGGGGAGNPEVTLRFVGYGGEDGSRSATVSAAGGPAIIGEGAGGAGGRGNALPQAGKKAMGSQATAGAGGGSVGYFQTYTPAGVTPSLTPLGASPAFQPNGTIPTR